MNPSFIIIYLFSSSLIVFVVTKLNKLFLSGSGTSSTEPSVEQDHSPELNSTTSTPEKKCTCPTTPNPTPGPTSSASSSCSAILGLLSVRWVSKCDAHIKLTPFPSSCPELHVCHDSDTKVKTILTIACKKRHGCKGDPVWRGGKDVPDNGYNITETGTSQISSCKKLLVKCEGWSTCLILISVISADEHFYSLFLFAASKRLFYIVMCMLMYVCSCLFLQPLGHVMFVNENSLPG